MYTNEELYLAKRTITIMAEKNNVPEQQIRTEIKEAISVSMNSADLHVQTKWAECERSGREPTPEEVIIWIAKKVNARIKDSSY